MKPRILRIFNTAVATALNTFATVCNALVLPEGDAKEQWQVLVPYGEYPAVTVVNGKKVTIVQVLDRAAGDLMAENFNTVANTVRHLGRGLPIYIEHPDNPEWRSMNPGADPSAKGRIKKLEAREDAVYMLTAYNSDGLALIGGEVPKYSAQSPNWDMLPLDAAQTRWRPFLLRSIGLTNNPNITQCAIGLNTAGAFTNSQADAASAAEAPENQNEMKLTPEALKALGFAPDATPSPEEISAAIIKVASEKTTADAAKATADAAVTAANTRAATAETNLENFRGTMIATALNTAITGNRITAAQKPRWEGLLKADFALANQALADLPQVTGLNTESQIGDQGNRHEGPAPAGSINAINTAVADYAKANGLNLKVKSQYDTAYAAVQAAKPDLFK